MKITISKRALSEAISAVSSVIRTRTTLPVLSRIKLDACKSATSLYGTDLDCAYVRTVEASVIEPGTVLLPASRVREWLGVVDGANVTIEADDSQLHLSTEGSGRINFSTMKADEFPPLPATDGKPVATVDLAPLKHIAWSMMQDDLSRPALCAACIDAEGDALLIGATTDGRKLGTVALPAQIDAGWNKEPIQIPADYVGMVSGIGECALAESENNLFFTTATEKVIVRKSTEVFPKWRQYVDLKKFPIVGSITVMRDEFASAIGQCHILRGDQIGSERGVRIEISKEGDGMLVEVSMQGTGDSFRTVIEGRSKGKFPKMVLDTQHLYPFTLLKDESPLQIEFTSDRTLVHMHAPDIGVKYFFMPCMPVEAKK